MIRPQVVDLMVAADQWCRLSTERRLHVLKRALPGPRWAALRSTMATATPEQMTQVQLESLPTLLRYAK